MKLFALDASAWLRLFLHDGPAPAALEPAAAAVERGDAAFVAPELILVEAAHALERKRRNGRLSSDEAGALWVDMRKTPIDLLPISEHIDAARDLAERHGLSAYDALYAAVAEHVGASLLTADAELQRVAEKLHLAP